MIFFGSNIILASLWSIANSEQSTNDKNPFSFDDLSWCEEKYYSIVFFKFCEQESWLEFTN